MIVKRFVYLVTILGIGFPFQGCDYIRTLRMTNHFLDSKLVLSSKMIKVADGLVTECEYSQEMPVYVLYYAPDECTECALNHVFVNKPYFDFAKRRGDFETILVIAPKMDQLTEALTRAVQLESPFPIYIDSEHHLEKQDVIPKDERFHSFLLDKRGSVIYIGRPLSSQRAQQRFIQYLNKL